METKLGYLNLFLIYCVAMLYFHTPLFTILGLLFSFVFIIVLLPVVNVFVQVL